MGRRRRERGASVLKRRQCHAELYGIDPHPRRRRGTDGMTSEWRGGKGGGNGRIEEEEEEEEEGTI